MMRSLPPNIKPSTITVSGNGFWSGAGPLNVMKTEQLATYSMSLKILPDAERRNWRPFRSKSCCNRYSRPCQVQLQSLKLFMTQKARQKTSEYSWSMTLRLGSTLQVLVFWENDTVKLSLQLRVMASWKNSGRLLTKEIRSNLRCSILATD